MEKICPEKICTGCEACVNICPKNCIEMISDSEGFLFPHINTAQCIDCGLCKKTCPVQNPIPYNPQGIVYAAYALDQQIRTTSSSGGLFSVLASYVLKNDGAVNGTKFDNLFNLKHHIATDTSLLAEFRGSKYVQSQPGTIYRQIKDILETGKPVLFTSTPCQIAGLYSFLGRKYTNLYTCDLVCHGVPSPMFFKDYIADMSNKYNLTEVKDFSFRKLDGWGKDSTIILKNAKRISLSGIDNYYTTAFFAKKNARFSCYNCAFATSRRVGDITLGDFLGLGLIRHFSQDTTQGCSLVLINSPQGEALFNIVKNQLFAQRRNFCEAKRKNYQLSHPIELPPCRKNFYTAYKILSRQDFYASYIAPPPNNTLSLKSKILVRKMKNFILLCLYGFISKINFSKWG